jgi:two-component system, cell cycle sensor histidine kinase and response regulator CckA
LTATGSTVLEAGVVQALQELAAATASVLDPQPLAQLATQHAQRLLNADDAVLYWWADATARLRALAYTGPVAPPPPTWLRPGQGMAGQAFEQRETVVVEDYPSWEHALVGSLERGVISAAAVPLVIGRRSVGALIVGSQSPRSFTPQELSALTLLAAQVSPSIEVARAYREAATLRRTAEAQTREAEQRRAELADAEKRLLLLVDAIGSGVVMRDRHRHVIHANAAAQQLLGMTMEDLRALGPEPLWTALREDGTEIPPADRLGWQSILAGRVSRNRLTQARVRSGETRWFRVDTAPVRGADGELAYTVVSFVDVSEQRRIEEQLLRAQRLEAAGRIAGRVAHDFNNLLAPLAGYPELIKMRLPPEHPAVAYCDDLLHAAHEMAEISQDLMALGRRGLVEQQAVDLNHLVQEALVQMPAAEPGLAIEQELQPGLLPVRGSPAQMLRVIVNLVANARDAMGKQGTLRLRTENLYLSAPAGHDVHVPPGEYVRLQVVDTGPGIPAEIRTQIFDAYFTTKSLGRHRGSGLGLSVVQAIVQDHGGYVDVESVVGDGTTINVYLPPGRDLAPAEELTTAVRGDEVILLVDDDPLQRRVAGALLENLGYQVAASASGEEALAYLQDHAADLVLLDMVMGDGIDGAETYRRIQKLRPGQRAILLSGFAETTRVREALSLGALGHVRKPVTLEELGHAVRRALDHSEMRD